jgi:hypothetical protein
MAKTYYITPQLVYVTVEESENGNHPVNFSNNGECITFNAHVYTNALNSNPRADYLCGIKIKDDVAVKIPVTTPSITF